MYEGGQGVKKRNCDFAKHFLELRVVSSRKKGDGNTFQ